MKRKYDPHCPRCIARANDNPFEFEAVCHQSCPKRGQR